MMLFLDPKDYSYSVSDIITISACLLSNIAHWPSDCCVSRHVKTHYSEFDNIFVQKIKERDRYLHAIMYNEH